ncbi:hypothetical protein [Nostoc sp. PA-18-2419]|nr:hypothetical protein [Nostoc sp. PA-18-2419]
MPLVKRGLSRLQLVGGRERSNAWMERCKSLVKNEEANIASCDCQAQSMFYQTHA